MDQIKDFALLRWAARLLATFALALAACVPSLAQAQNFLNNADDPIPLSTNCASTLTRTFTITNSQTITDLNVGIIISHTYRGDLRIWLSHTPDGGTTTTIPLMTNIGGAADNLNVLFDDQATSLIANHTANDTIPAAPGNEPASPTSPFTYASTFKPQGGSASVNAIANAFGGRDMKGTWAVSVCDSATGDDGILRSVQLMFADPIADLAVTITDGVTSVGSGGTSFYTITVTNNGPNNATGAVLRMPVAASQSRVAVTCGNSPGACSSTTTPTVSELENGYALPTLASGSTYQIRVQTVVTTTSTSVTATAQVTAPAGRTDNVGGNNNASDTNSVTARVAQTPPTLMCPAGSTARPFNWQPSSWPVSSTSNTINMGPAGQTLVSFSFTPGSGAFAPKAAISSSNTPYISSALSFGLTPNPSFLIVDVDFVDQTGVMTGSYKFENPIPGAQFQLFDIDYSANSWADMVTVIARKDGVNVPVTLSSGVSNYAIGNVFYGDGASSDASSNGNAWVTITEPFDEIEFIYGNHTRIQTITSPVAQFIAWGSFTTICDPYANLSVTKASNIIATPDAPGGATFATPGSTVRYCVTVTNNGPSRANGVVATDSLPANVTFVAGSLRSGATCATATTAEDADDVGADESDPFGASIAGTVVTGRAAALTATQSAAFTFEALIR